jgi:hypothetical protein
MAEIDGNISFLSELNLRTAGRGRSYTLRRRSGKIKMATMNCIPCWQSGGMGRRCIPAQQSNSGSEIRAEFEKASRPKPGKLIVAVGWL